MGCHNYQICLQESRDRDPLSRPLTGNQADLKLKQTPNNFLYVKFGELEQNLSAYEQLQLLACIIEHFRQKQKEYEILSLQEKSLLCESISQKEQKRNQLCPNEN
ncbi:hypothetical protein Ddye_021940 [Dipteronia dyeriana]|uniref:Uncharacterized protein n=1 Tax=Dipteronia dyeriana TaxID=168575 RepID=A0AAD9U2J3_9ROSI|nr:hypothetical protein Ddye_021940 [Dipteronia dyeriana]